MNLYSNLVEVKNVGNRNSLLNALNDLCDFDADFNGENGIEYLWDCVWEENGFHDYQDFIFQIEEYDSDFDDDFEEIELKYESNLDYLLDRVKDVDDDKELVKTFVEYWMEQDSGYYADYQCDMLTDTNGNVTAINLAVVSR